MDIRGMSCIVSNFYIKSQPVVYQVYSTPCCIVSNFYIKSQLEANKDKAREGCIVSNFYIKSQLWTSSMALKSVV